MMKFQDDSNSYLLNIDKKDLFINPVNQKLTLVIPNSVTLIAGMAFYNCKDIQSIKLSNNIIAVAAWVFSFFDKLEYITMPNSWRVIDYHVFDGCSKLKGINFSSNLSAIRSSAFINCINLQCLIFPDSLKSIDFFASKGCKSLNRIKFGKNLKSLHFESFANCINLRQIEFNESIESVNDTAFDGCEPWVIIHCNDQSRQKIINLLPAHLQIKVVSAAIVDAAQNHLKSKLLKVLNTPEIHRLYPYFNKSNGGVKQVLYDDIFILLNYYQTDNLIYRKIKSALEAVFYPTNIEELAAYKIKLDIICNKMLNKIIRKVEQNILLGLERKTCYEAFKNKIEHHLSFFSNHPEKYFPLKHSLNVVNQDYLSWEKIEQEIENLKFYI